jgi:hypothetical protein
MSRDKSGVCLETNYLSRDILTCLETMKKSLEINSNVSDKYQCLETNSTGLIYLKTNSVGQNRSKNREKTLYKL